jgi:molybdenum cofactor cytidylyltransferase
MKTGVLILAAGKASRMGKAKMLLPYHATNILSNLIEEIKATHPAGICLVTGYFHQQIKEVIQDQLVQVVFNEQWNSGMAGSIQSGLSCLLKDHPDLDAVLIVVSDQPFLNRNIIRKLLEEQAITGKGIVAAGYAAIKGTPVLFQQKYFSELQNLRGDKGARAILQVHPEDIATVAFPLGELDIDTPEDYEKYCSALKEQHAKRPVQ